MSYFNTIGRLGADVKPIGDKVSVLSVASNYAKKTTWHRIMIYTDKFGGVIKYLKKGTPVYIEGYITTRKNKTSGFEETILNGVKIQFFGMSKKEEGVSEDGGNVSTEEDTITTDEDVPF